MVTDGYFLSGWRPTAGRGNKAWYWALTLTSSLWLMARAECSRALMTEA